MSGAGTRNQEGLVDGGGAPTRGFGRDEVGVDKTGMLGA